MLLRVGFGYGVSAVGVPVAGGCYSRGVLRFGVFVLFRVG